MSYWDYRLVKHEYTNEEVSLQITEVYYDDNENIIAWGDAPTPYGESVEDVKECLNLMEQALSEPIIDYKDLYINKDHISEVDIET